MTLRELLCNHNRGQIEDWTRARAKSAYLGDAVLCRILGSHNLYVDPANTDMAPWIMLDGLWEMWCAMAIGRAIQPGWTCVDAGAWCGYYSVIMADLVGPGGKLIAFEPIADHAALCGRSLAANGFHWGSVRNAAIGAVAGNQAFERKPIDGGSGLNPLGSSTVHVETIDGLGLPKIDLIKMDIEGGERDAWDGLQGTIDCNPNIIIVMEWDSRRYADARAFAETIAKRFTLREITTDGLTTPISIDELLKPVMRNLWLQK